MFEYCNNCIKKHKNSICECQYDEVNRFIEILNFKYNKKYQLVSCPDEDNNSINTVDLQFCDELSRENLYIEIKEIKIGYDNNNINIAEEKGQFSIGNAIAVASYDIDESKNSILNKCMIDIPKIQMNKNDYFKFIGEFKDFFNKKIEFVNNGALNFSFRKCSRDEDEINLKISLKDEGVNRINGDTLMYLYDTKGNTSEEIFNSVTDINDLGLKIERNIHKTKSSKNKFPINNGKRILLNVLRFPPMNEMFFNVALVRGYFEKIKNVKNIINNKCNSIDENYLLYYFDDFVYLDESVIKHDLPKMLLCNNIFGELLKGCFFVECSTCEEYSVQYI